MKLFEQIESAEKIINRVDESGVRGIKELAKTYKTATGYFHQDLDGVTSAIAMKMYLQSYGIKTTKFIPINYGGSEFKASIPQKGTLTWMVDFAHGKPFLDIHTDHHDGQTGVTSTTSTAFVKAPSNLANISMELSPRDLFPAQDVKIISMVDSADFAKNSITPDQVMNAAFGYDDSLNVERNKTMMGLVVNKLLLANKNKKDFLVRLVTQANPSLVSMYTVIKKLSKEDGYKAPAEISSGMKGYVSQQKGKMQEKGKDPSKLNNGETTQWGNVVVQYGGGSMFKAYDRYTPFKLYPDAQFLVIAWPMGLIQASKNPFLSGKNPQPLGDLVLKKILPKWKNKLSKEITLDDLKRTFEMDIKPADRDAMGFKWEDLVAMFKPNQVKGLDLAGEGGWTKFIQSITNVKYANLSYKQKSFMKKITVNLWDIIQSQSGGHKDITNLQGLSFYGKGYVDEILKPIMKDIAEEMKDMRLE